MENRRSNGSLNFCLRLFSVSEIDTTNVYYLVFYFDVSLLLCSLYKGLNEFDFNISRVPSRKQYVSKFKVVFKMMSIIQLVVCNTSFTFKHNFLIIQSFILLDLYFVCYDCTIVT
jgi:hypothetical protein